MPENYLIQSGQIPEEILKQLRDRRQRFDQCIVDWLVPKGDDDEFEPLYDHSLAVIKQAAEEVASEAGRLGQKNLNITSCLIKHLLSDISEQGFLKAKWPVDIDGLVYEYNDTTTGLSSSLLLGLEGSLRKQIGQDIESFGEWLGDLYIVVTEIFYARTFDFEATGNPR